jgi:hypothetical protein
MIFINICFIYYHSDKKLNREEEYMVERRYKKGLVVGIIILFLAVSIVPSINANIDRLPVKNKLVETMVRIHNSRGIIPFTLKISEKQSDEIDRIFDNLKISLDTAVTDDEIDEIYDDAVVSLYELGLFSRMTLKEAKQLVNGKSKNQRVAESSSNLGNVDENFNCRVIGWTTNTVMFDLGRLLWNIILEEIIRFLFHREYNTW